MSSLNVPAGRAQVTPLQAEAKSPAADIIRPNNGRHEFAMYGPMDVTDLGFLAAGALAVAVGLTAPLRPDMLALKGTSAARACLAAVACSAACAALIAISPGMLKNTPLAAVLALSLVHAAVTAVKWRREHAQGPAVERARPDRLSRRIA